MLRELNISLRVLSFWIYPVYFGGSEPSKEHIASIFRAGEQIEQGTSAKQAVSKVLFAACCDAAYNLCLKCFYILRI
jgi:hypothetical protein